MVWLEFLHCQGSQKFIGSPGSTHSNILNLHKTLFQKNIQQEHDA